jgi:hypothetical protein
MMRLARHLHISIEIISSITSRICEADWPFTFHTLDLKFNEGIIVSCPFSQRTLERHGLKEYLYVEIKL